MIAHYADRLQSAIRARRTPLVVGIDPVLQRLPAALRPDGRSTSAAVHALERFSREVIDAVAPHVPAVKINSAFFEAFQEAGLAACFRLIEHAHGRGLLVIADVKRADIGSTAAFYARGLLNPECDDVPAERLPDAITLAASYLGEGAVRPFIDAARATGRGLYVLVRPSDPGADRVHEFGAPGTRFYEFLADQVAAWGSGPELIGACGLSLVGAVVAPKDGVSTQALRNRMPHTPWLSPGMGAQGASADDCRPCFRPSGDGAIINASRSVIFAYEDSQRLGQAGGDWRACVARAAAETAELVARAIGG